MSTSSVPIFEDVPSTRNRSTSISRNSSSSGEQHQHQQKKSKPSAFKSFFAVKEPSAVAFQQLAEQQKKELAEKGQKVPFGVPIRGIPSSAEEDYKKAKERAKERARLYAKEKERLKAQEEHDRALAKVRAEQRGPSSELEELEEKVAKLRTQISREPIEYRSLDPKISSSSAPALVARKTHRRWKAPSLDSLPETSFVSLPETSAMGSSVYSSSPSMPLTPSSPPASLASTRKEVAPWNDVAPWEEEEEEEEEFPMRESSKKKGYFSTFRRR